MSTEDNVKEKDAIEELKKRMESNIEREVYEDDRLFYRFLKARDFNIDQAEAMLRKHLEFRGKHNIKNISSWKVPEVLEKYLCDHKVGYDKTGCVIRYVPVGDLDWKGLIASTKYEDWIMLSAYYMEMDIQDMKRQKEKLNRSGDKIILINNFKNLSLSQAIDKNFIRMSIISINTVMDNYPERLKSIYVINANTYFTLLFSAVKSFLPSTIFKKIKIFSNDDWKKELLNVIDSKVLPSCLEDKDGNNMCPSLIHHAKKVPESYYIQSHKKSLAASPGIEKVSLSSGEFYERNIEVKQPGCYLEWEFETKNRDIGFGFFYQDIIDGEERMEEIIPIQRIDTEEYPETGVYKCLRAGTYIIIFDNTYSLMRSKQIFYRVKIVSPEQQESALTNSEE